MTMPGRKGLDDLNDGSFELRRISRYPQANKRILHPT